MSFAPSLELTSEFVIQMMPYQLPYSRPSNLVHGPPKYNAPLPDLLLVPGPATDRARMSRESCASIPACRPDHINRPCNGSSHLQAGSSQKAESLALDAS